MARPAIVYECDGFKYIVLDVFRKNDYGVKRVYHILTDNQKWCGNVIDKIMDDGSMSRGLWQTVYDRTKSIFDWPSYAYKSGALKEWNISWHKVPISKYQSFFARIKLKS